MRGEYSLYPCVCLKLQFPVCICILISFLTFCNFAESCSLEGSNQDASSSPPFKVRDVKPITGLLPSHVFNIWNIMLSCQLLANYFYKFTSCGLIERGIWLSIHKSYCVYVAKMQTLHAIGNSPWWTSGHLHLILFLVFPSRIGKLNCIQFFHSLFGGQLAMCSIYERLINNKQ
jgi:hypothetical protein